MRSLPRVVIACSMLTLAASPIAAQAPTPPAPPTPPPPVFSGSLGAGLTLTRGNVDTTNVNFSFDTKYAPSPVNVLKAEGLYIRGRTDGEDTANRLGLQGRFEHLLGARAFAFGQLQYVRDPFKAIDYLVAPTAGVGYKIVDTPATQFSADTSFGVVWEKNPSTPLKTSPAWNAGEKLSHKLSATATATESAQALWKLNDFGDSLYAFGVGLETAIAGSSQLKVELRDTYKTAPPEGTQSNDLALLLSLVVKY